ncbi:hypothetical protein ACJJI4_18780 [Microbulbifer sp. TRSA002]|uniref:hypothetical protein n=1 Tax=Microbulbifer sp. TRSA002 TaxID=3243382 RepID=UPI00403A07FA
MSHKFCIFCGESGLSKEHFWPNWMRGNVNLSISDKHANEVYSGEAKSEAALEKRTERSGNLITLKFRVVCKACNNGWMSQLDNTVKPILKAGLEKTDYTLQENDIEALSKWAVMKVIVAENNHDGTQVTPSCDRKQFFKSLTIPGYYRVFLGRHSTDSVAAYHRHTSTIAFSKDGPMTDLKGLERNTQTISFLIGSLFIYVVACREQDFKIWQNFKLNELKCLHPCKKTAMNLKSLRIIKQSRLADIAHSLEDFTKSPEVAYGGALQKKF